MSMLVSVSSAVQFLLLPLAGVISDTVGRKPLMIARGLSSTLFSLLVVVRPTFLTVCIRECSACTQCTAPSCVQTHYLYYHA